MYKPNFSMRRGRDLEIFFFAGILRKRGLWLSVRPTLVLVSCWRCDARQGDLPQWKLW